MYLHISILKKKTANIHIFIHTDKNGSTTKLTKICSKSDKVCGFCYSHSEILIEVIGILNEYFMKNNAQTEI